MRVCVTQGLEDLVRVCARVCYAWGVWRVRCVRVMRV